jgi:hypothetical protein
MALEVSSQCTGVGPTTSGSGIPVRPPTATVSALRIGGGVRQSGGRLELSSLSINGPQTFAARSDQGSIIVVMPAQSLSSARDVALRFSR